MVSKSSNQHKGDSFEKLVFAKLKELIESQDVPGISRYNEIFYISNMLVKLLLMLC